jgi:hypothetical protein
MNKQLLWFFSPTRCDVCHRIKPAFDFTVYGWHDVYWCRKCYNREFGEDYFIGFTDSIRFTFKQFFKKGF